MIIVTGGIHRSGTTWLYNCVKNLFDEYNYCFYENINLYPNTIYKSHTWHEEFVNTDSILITRDIRSVAASLLSFKPLKNYYNINENNIIRHLEKTVVEECELWQPKLKLKYEDGKLKNTQKIIDHFLIDKNAESIVQKTDQIEQPKHTRDIHTELWPNHITGSSMANLPVKLCDEISIHFGWWLEKHGYRI